MPISILLNVSSTLATSAELADHTGLLMILTVEELTFKHVFRFYSRIYSIESFTHLGRSHFLQVPYCRVQDSRTNFVTFADQRGVLISFLSKTYLKSRLLYNAFLSLASEACRFQGSHFRFFIQRYSRISCVSTLFPLYCLIRICNHEIRPSPRWASTTAERLQSKDHS